jgi:hypothetical protein
MDLRVSWRRRYSSYVSLYLGNSVPILVYQMGKVGSSSIRNTLLLLGLHPVLHLHTFSPLREKSAADVRVEAELAPTVAREIEHAQSVFTEMGRWARLRLVVHEHTNERRLAHRLLRPGAPLRIISSVREPIAANVSMFFQLLPWYTHGRYRPDGISTDELIRMFFERYSCGRPLIWFDEEMKYNTGIDVFRHPFAKERGSLAFREGDTDVLVLKTETEDAQKEEALSRFLGMGRIRLAKSNVAADKAYAEQYAEFKQRIRFPEAFFRTMYESKYARHFYDADELQCYGEQWHRSEEPATREA